MDKHTVLLIMHMPPPVHGASMVGKYIHDSGVINETFDCHYINLTTSRNLQDIGKMKLHKLLDFYRLIRNIRKEVRRLRPGLVYVTANACGGAFYKDFIVVRMLKRMGCKVIVHYHNKGVASRQGRRVDNLLYRHFFSDIKVMLLAPALYADIKQYVKPADVFYCPNGIPETLVDEPEVKQERDVPHILFLSNLIISKGVLVLLDALKELRQRGCEFQCSFVGGETAELNMEGFDHYLLVSGLSDCVRYVGRKYGDEKAEVFKDADIFVFPTYYSKECFPLVCLEAMEWKLPVISTDEGGIPDIVKHGENGFIVSCRRNGNFNDGPSAADLADVMERLVRNPALCRRMGEEGYRKFKEHFTLQAFERRFAEGLDWAIRQ